MKRLTHRQTRALLTAVSELHTSHDPASLPDRVFAAARRIVATDWVALTVWDTAGIREPTPTAFPISMMHAEPHIEITPTMRETYNGVFHEEPFRRRFLQNGFVIPHRICDIMPDSRYYRLGIYNEHYRKIGIDRAMVVGLSAMPDDAVTVTLSRHKKEFADDELAAFAALRTHMIAARESAQAFAELQCERAQHKHALEDSGRALLILDARGRVRYETSRARDLLTKYFDSPPGDRLPEELTCWLAHRNRRIVGEDLILPPVPPLEIKRGDAILRIRLSGGGGTEMILLLDEDDSTPQVTALETLGLTKRESEVLCWVTRGKTNAEVAVLSEMSARTVQKHLEHVFQKLGTETRTAAARVAIETMRNAKRQI